MRKLGLLCYVLCNNFGIKSFVACGAGTAAWQCLLQTPWCPDSVVQGNWDERRHGLKFVRDYAVWKVFPLHLWLAGWDVRPSLWKLLKDREWKDLLHGELPLEPMHSGKPRSQRTALSCKLLLGCDFLTFISKTPCYHEKWITLLYQTPNWGHEEFPVFFRKEKGSYFEFPPCLSLLALWRKERTRQSLR